MSHDAALCHMCHMKAGGFKMLLTLCLDYICSSLSKTCRIAVILSLLGVTYMVFWLVKITMPGLDFLILELNVVHRDIFGVFGLAVPGCQHSRLQKGILCDETPLCHHQDV